MRGGGGRVNRRREGRAGEGMRKRIHMRKVENDRKREIVKKVDADVHKITSRKRRTSHDSPSINKAKTVKKKECKR